MARIDPDDPRAPYQQIADDLRREITSGVLAPGKRLDSSRQLAARYGVAPMTVHQALRVLRDEGLVDTLQGRGAFVRDENEPRPLDIQTQVNQLQEQMEQLWSRVVAEEADEVTELRRKVGVLEAQLMELYARLGQPYPHDTGAGDPGEAPTRHRKASGA